MRSVVCADRIVATRSSSEEGKFSSVCASGYRAASSRPMRRAPRATARCAAGACGGAPPPCIDAACESDGAGGAGREREKRGGGRAGPAGPGTAASEDGESAGLTGARARLRAAASNTMIPGLRRHGLLAALVLAGLVLRVLSLIAYRPALLYIDTLKYLYNAWPGADPLGYSGPLKAILVGGHP